MHKHASPSLYLSPIQAAARKPHPQYSLTETLTLIQIQNALSCTNITNICTKHKGTLLTSHHDLWPFEKKTGPCFLSMYVYIQPQKWLITSISGKLGQKPNKTESKNFGLAARALILCFSSADEPKGFPTDTLKWAPWSLCLESQQTLCFASHPVVWSLPEKKKGEYVAPACLLLA